MELDRRGVVLSRSQGPHDLVQLVGRQRRGQVDAALAAPPVHLRHGQEGLAGQRVTGRHPPLGAAPEDTEWGTRRARLLDPEGQEWSFGTYAPGSTW